MPSALVVGSMAPDLAYFLPWEIGRARSHSLIGLLGFCLPVAFLAYASFHLLLAPLVDALAPSTVRTRLPEGWARAALPRAGFGPVATSLLAGAVTHLVWDAFTHRTGAVVELLPVLREPIATIGGYTVQGFKILQHGSGVLGMALLAWWCRRWIGRAPRRERARPRPAASRLLALSALLFPAAVAAVLAGAGALVDGSGALRQLQHVVGAAIFAGGSVFLASSLVVGLLWRPSSEQLAPPGARLATTGLYAAAFVAGSLVALAPALMDLLPAAIPLAPAFAVRGLSGLSNGAPLVVDALPAALVIVLLGWRSAGADRWRLAVAAGLCVAGFAGGRLEVPDIYGAV